LSETITGSWLTLAPSSRSRVSAIRPSSFAARVISSAGMVSGRQGSSVLAIYIATYIDILEPI